MIKAIFISTALSLSAHAAEHIIPQPIDYAKMSFYPDRWVSEEVDQLDMVAWAGEKVALVTTNTKLDPAVITDFVEKLDSAYTLYHELTGYTPRIFKSIDNKATICALPKNNLSCGYGCGYIGSTGIEMIEFYDVHYPGLIQNSKNIPHCYFYEMGRNYFGFKNRHSCFTTGFAVFMRYVCIDSLNYFDKDVKTRSTINSAITLFEKSDMSFVSAFTDKAGSGEKGNRLKDENGKTIRPSDQNVMYASLMLKLRNENGGNDFIKRFYQNINECPAIQPIDESTARQQCVNLMISASAAARKDLTPYFTDKLKLRISEETRKTLASVAWDEENLKVSEVIKSL